MRALALVATGGLDQLRVMEVADPTPPGAGEVQVRIRSAALNRLDLFVADGIPGGAPLLPHVVGADGAGVVSAVGAGVTTVKVGDEVMFDPGVSCGDCPACRAGDEPFCTTYQILGEHRHGSIAELLTLPARNLAPRPAGWSWNESAAFSLAALTAWRMLVTRAKLRSGETVLIWGAGGGVAQACIGIAKQFGARVIATSSSSPKLELARTLGADLVIDHSQQDVVAEVKGATGRKGCDVVVDNVGAVTWERSLRSLSR